MAIQRPYNINIRGTTVSREENSRISWQTAGAISTAFSINIYKNSDNSLVWSYPKTSSFALEYFLPSNTLSYGEYKIEITAYDKDNNSATSYPEVFQVSSRPIVSIPVIGTIAAPSYLFSATYSQAQSIPLRSYIALIYDSNKTLIDTSPVQTSTPIQYLFSGLQSEKPYYIEFQITSNNGLTGTSGLVYFYVLYTQPRIDVNLTARNVNNAGIEISWKTVQVIGKTDGSPTYINNEKINLKNGTKVWFSEGFTLTQNGTIKLWVEDIVTSKDIFTLSGTNGKLRLQFWTEDNKFHLFKEVNNYKSHYASPSITGTNFFVFIQLINGDCNLMSQTLN